MVQALPFDAYGDGIGAGWMVVREHANRAGPEAPVPTCPGWTVRDLVAHQGTVHRWATGHLRGDRIDAPSTEAAGREATDQLEWFDEGAKDLLQALADAPEDLDTYFFLADAPPPRLAWARRQCHETTIHGVDAMAASSGRVPSAEETWIGPGLAADGVDELLTGFLPRGRQHPGAGTPRTIVVATNDTGHAWTLRTNDDPVVTTRERAAGADAILTGTAAGLYLGLWNRGDEIATEGADVLPWWRERVVVT